MARYFIRCLSCNEKFAADGEYAGSRHGCETILKRLHSSARALHEGSVSWMDGNWRRGLVIHELKARKTDHKCGPKCLTAKGPSCDCECGGENHGSGCVA